MKNRFNGYNKDTLYKKLPDTIPEEYKIVIVNGLLDNLNTEDKKMFLNIMNNHKDEFIEVFLKKKISFILVVVISIIVSCLNLSLINNAILCNIISVITLILTSCIIGKVSISKSLKDIDNYITNLETQIELEVEEKLKKDKTYNLDNDIDKELNHKYINNIYYTDNKKLVLRKGNVWKK